MGDDIFDSSLHLEQQFIDEGHAQGVKDGREAGLREGRELGVTKGFEIGEEVGFIWGSVKAWRLADEHQPGWLPARAARAVAAIEQLLQDFPGHPQDERLQDALAELRGKYKAAASMLGLLDAYGLAQGPAQTTAF